MARILIAATAFLLAAVATYGQDDEPAVSVHELMLTVIAPATDTLWGIGDPQSDEEWQVFIDAANLVIDSAAALLQGGTGPYDNAWAASPEWRAFAEQLVAAGRDARAAAEERNLEAMWAAGEVLYPPCEDCHLKFNPGVLGEQ